MKKKNHALTFWVAVIFVFTVTAFYVALDDETSKKLLTIEVAGEIAYVKDHSDTIMVGDWISARKPVKGQYWETTVLKNVGTVADSATYQQFQNVNVDPFLGGSIEYELRFALITKVE